VSKSRFEAAPPLEWKSPAVLLGMGGVAAAALAPYSLVPAGLFAVGCGGAALWLGLRADQRSRELDRQVQAMGAELADSEGQALIRVRRAEVLGGLSARVRGEQSVIELCENALRWLCDALEVPVGAVYVREDRELALVATFAWTEGSGDIRYRLGEGLVGQCALERRPIRLRDVPQDFLRVSSGLVSRAPMAVLIEPIVFEGELYGVLELGVMSIEQYEIVEDLLSRGIEIIGTAMRSAKIREAVVDQQRALADSESKTRAILDAARDVIVSVDEGGVVRSANRAAAEIFGYSDLVGRPLRQIVPGITLMDILLGAADRTWIGRKLDGTQLSITIAMSPFEVGGQRLYAGIIRDVSAFDEWERRLTAQAEALQESNEELREAKRVAEEHALVLAEQSRFKSEFLANMSHELRTPLNSMLILSDILAENRSANLTEREVEFARTIHGSGSDLLTLINDILDLAKVESGKMTIEARAVQIRDVEARVRRMFEPIARRDRIELRVEIDPEVPPVIVADPTRLVQVLNNLLSNAFKFTSEGSVTLSILADGPRLRFTVSDTGIGIPAERQAAVFESFQQVDGGTTRRYGGTGLGLAISRQIVERMDGEITVRSELGQGSTFIVDLPLCVALPPVAQPSPPQLAAAHPPPPPPQIPESMGRILDGRTVLVVDDDIRNVFAMSTALERHGMEVRPAESAQAALDVLATEPVDAILMDIMMPRMNGYDAMRTIRAMPAFAHLPIIAITAQAMKGDREKCLAAGANDYVAKPIDIGELLHALGRCIGYRAAS